MRVEQNNKTLYRIQNMNMGSDGYPLDAYIFCDHEPNEKDLRKIFDIEYGYGYDGESEKCALKEWLTTSDICAVYAEEF